MKLRIAKPDDLDQLVELNRLCYPTLGMTPDQIRGIYTANTRCTWDDVFVVTENSRIVSALIAYKFTQYLEDTEIDTIGIGDVIVSPASRRQGVGGFLIEEVLKHFEEKDYPASILYPFQHRFYRRLGWGYAGELRHYHYPTDQLREYADYHEEEDLSVQLLTSAKLPQLLKFYDAQARRCNGMLKRSPEYWQDRILRSPRTAVLALSSGDIIGYLIYSISRHHPNNRLVQELDVHEWLAPTLEAKSLLLGFLNRQKEQIKSVHLHLPPDEPIHLMVEDPRDAAQRMENFLYTHTADLCLGWMYRIVNLKAALECGRRFNNISGDLTIKLEDEQIGDRSLNVRFKNGKVETSDANQDCRRKISGSVDAFSQMYCGYTSALAAFEFDLLEFDGPDTVEFCQHAFSLPIPRCFDLF
ncbi:MAG: GNAT family N-acetyltransferase [bacterium]|nr:GNAT family N-acetyltransferase [bacterium]